MRQIGEVSWEDAWSAVITRDRALDGVLFYAVRTTGIYGMWTGGINGPHGVFWREEPTEPQGPTGTLITKRAPRPSERRSEGLPGAVDSKAESGQPRGPDLSYFGPFCRAIARAVK